MNATLKSHLLFILLTLDYKMIVESNPLTKEDNYQYLCQLKSSNVICIETEDNIDFDLIAECKRLSEGLNETEKALKQLLIYSNIVEIPENAFYDLTFESVRIANALRLERIHSKAFNLAMRATMTKFSVGYPSSLVSIAPDFDLYSALNSLENVQAIEISLKVNTSHDIPADAFANEQASLRSVEFISNKRYDENDVFTLNNLAGKQFRGLTNLNWMVFDGVNIENIGSDGFYFDKEPVNGTKEYAFIQFIDNQLVDKSFDRNCFVGSKKNIQLLFSKCTWNFPKTFRNI